jgi:hypothetical protein
LIARGKRVGISEEVIARVEVMLVMWIAVGACNSSPVHLADVAAVQSTLESRRLNQVPQPGTSTSVVTVYHGLFHCFSSVPIVFNLIFYSSGSPLTASL